MKVISYKQLPTRYPTHLTLTCWLLLDRLHADRLLYGIIGTLLVILWVICIYASWKEEQYNVKFEDKK